VFATSGSDRSICLYDLRTQTPMRKLYMMNKTNAICWNPMEPLNFTVANEDANLYRFHLTRRPSQCAESNNVTRCDEARV
jgi:WD repeat and SOF domain-containing protein 1